MKSLTNSLRIILAAGILASFVGCAGYRFSAKRDIPESGFYVDGSIDVGSETFYAANSPLPEEQRHIPIHKDDGNFPNKKGVTTDLRGDIGFSIFTRLEGSAGTKNLRLKTGVDEKLLNTGYGERKLQPLPPPWESYGYTNLKFNNLTHHPFVGLEGKILERYALGLEFGMPYFGVTMETGHHRWNREEPIYTDHWEGYGRSVGLQLTCNEPEGDYEILRRMIFRVRRDSYDPVLFDQKVNLELYSATLMLEFDF